MTVSNKTRTTWIWHAPETLSSLTCVFSHKAYDVNAVFKAMDEADDWFDTFEEFEGATAIDLLWSLVMEFNLDDDDCIDRLYHSVCNAMEREEMK